MTSFNNYERIIILENNSIQQIVLSDKNPDKKVLPTHAPSEDIVDYLEKNVLTDKNPYRDLIIAVFNSRIDGNLSLLEKIIERSKNSGNNTAFVLMAHTLEAGLYAHLKEIGVDNIVVGKENVQSILGLFMDKKTLNSNI